jgi:hypothetical protein
VTLVSLRQFQGNKRALGLLSHAFYPIQPDCIEHEDDDSEDSECYEETVDEMTPDDCVNDMDFCLPDSSPSDTSFSNFEDLEKEIVSIYLCLYFRWYEKTATSYNLITTTMTTTTTIIIYSNIIDNCYILYMVLYYYILYYLRHTC